MPRRIVIDTNVLYAALRSKAGASFQILEAIWSGKVTILLSQTVLMEYEEILRQDAPTLGLSQPEVDTILDGLCALCQKCEMKDPWTPLLPDEDDEAFVKVAVAGRALLDNP